MTIDPQFDPPRYAWNAATAAEALGALEAAEELIKAHLRTPAPGDMVGQHRVSNAAPAELTLSLDLSGLVQAVNDRAVLRRLDPAPACWCGREVEPGEDHALCFPGME